MAVKFFLPATASVKILAIALLMPISAFVGPTSSLAAAVSFQPIVDLAGHATSIKRAVSSEGMTAFGVVFDAGMGAAPQAIRSTQATGLTGPGTWPGDSRVSCLCNLFGAVLTTSIGTSANAQSGGDGASEVLHVVSPKTEPAVPLNLSLKVRVFAARRVIEIAVIITKHSAYPADLFFDRDVRAQIALLPGLELEGGSLSWSGDLKGEQVAEFVATVRAAQDTEGIIETTAIGHAMGGRIDAEKVAFHVLVHGDQIRVAPEPPMNTSPSRPGTGVQVK